MSDNPLLAESRRHLADLLEACQRCSWHLNATAARIDWPLTSVTLADRQMDLDLHERLAAVNERFAKLQDLLGTTLRHLADLSGERTETFLRVLAFCEKVGLLESTEVWHTCRALRNRAAHDYGTDTGITAAHFNAIYDLIPFLTDVTLAASRHARMTLGVHPSDDRFATALLSVRTPRPDATGP
jgi:hypothetical protein